MLFKQTVGACRTMMSMSIEIFYSGIMLLFQKKILMLLARWTQNAPKADLSSYC